MTGWQTIGGKTFYLKESGAGGDCGQVMKGWQVYKGRTYYLQMAERKAPRADADRVAEYRRQNVLSQQDRQCQLD